MKSFIFKYLGLISASITVLRMSAFTASSKAECFFIIKIRFSTYKHVDDVDLSITVITGIVKWAKT